MKLLSRLVYLGFCIAFGVVLSEVALRLAGLSGARERLEIYAFDPEIGWRTRPSSRFFRSTPYYAHFNYYDPDGFPASEARYGERLDPERPTIAFIGDSMAEGYYVPYEESITERVDRATPDDQVLNLGVSGYAPDQYLMAARRHLPSYAVRRIAVIFFPANDTVDVLKDRYLHYAKPLFGTSLERPSNVPLERLEPEQEGSGLRRAVRGLALYALLRPLYKTYIAPPSPYVPSRENLRYSEEGMVRSVEMMARIAEENPVARFQVFYIPRREELHERDLLERNLALFHGECDERGIACSAPAFLLEAEDPDRFYILGDGHLSAAGTAAFAGAFLGAGPG